MNYYHSPKTEADAIKLAQQCAGNFTFFAGGTDIQIYRKQKLDTKEHVIDLSAIKGLNSISVEDGKLSLGTLTTLDEIILSEIIQTDFSVLADASKTVATPVLRKTATIGGNILVRNRCTFYNQSKEWRGSIGSCLRDVGDICQVTGGKDDCYARNVSDTTTALIVLNADVELLTNDIVQTKQLKELYVPCGIKIHDLDQHSILTKISVPLSPVKSYFRKLRLRKTLDFTSLTVAGTLDSYGVARVCINGVSMSPILIEETLDTLTLDSLIKQARKNCKTVDNDLMPLKYRRQMINVFLEECWDVLTTQTQVH